MMPAFIITGSMIIPATWPSFSTRTRESTSRSLKGTTWVRETISGGMPVLAATLFGWSGLPRSCPVWYTETCTESWCPWYVPSTFTILHRPVAARIRWTASIVASVPELAKRHRGRPNRRARSSATAMASSVG
jgi:hypothetical protein